MSDVTMEALKAELDDYDWDDPATVATIGAYVVGPNVKRLASWSGMSRGDLSGPARRLRQNGIWRGGKVRTDTGGVPDGVEMVMQILVAQGMFEVARD